ncbi:MAG: PTS sugar transporter subunit IIA [Candidatus Hydrogenedentota bacterium]
MLLSHLLRSALIKPNLEAVNRREAIGEVLDLLVQDHEVPYAQRNSVFDEIMAREHVMGSGMEAGIAIPHVSTDRVDDILCALGTAPQGIPFESLDGQPCKIVLLMLIPPYHYEERIRTLEAIAEVFEHRNVVGRIVQAGDAQTIYDIIKEVEDNPRR